MTAQTAAPIELLYGALAVEGSAPSLPPSAAALANDVRTAKRGLGTQLLAMGIWCLRDAGAVDFELRKGKSLGFIPKTELVVSPKNGAAGWTGIEGELLAKLAEKGPRDVTALVGAWYGRRGSGNPDRVVVERVRDAAIAAGLVRSETVDANRGFLGRAVLGGTKQSVVLNDAAFAAAGSALEDLAAGWTAFTRREPELARELLERVEKAIDRKEIGDNDSGGGGVDFD
jgi:hypothetical protein